MIDIIDYVEPHVGYRSFRMPGPFSNGRLRSIVFEDEWPPASYGGMTAQCHFRRSPEWWFEWIKTHVLPDRACKSSPGERCKSRDHPCGIYAYKSPLLLKQRWQFGVVFAEVLLGGRVFRHEYGWRAQYAAVSGIYTFVPPGMSPRLREERMDRLSNIAERYEVPLLQW